MTEAVSLLRKVMDCERSSPRDHAVVIPAGRYCLGIGIANQKD